MTASTMFVAVCSPLALAAFAFAQGGKFAEPPPPTQQLADPPAFLVPPIAGQPLTYAQQGMTDFTVLPKDVAALVQQTDQNFQDTQSFQQMQQNFQQTQQNFQETQSFQQMQQNFQQPQQNFQETQSFQQMPQNVQQTSRNFQQMPQNAQQTPQNFQQMPQNMQQTSQNFEQEAANIEELHLALQPPSP